MNNNTYALKDKFSSNELENSKLYLFQILSSDTTINFQFDGSITSNSIIEIFTNPTVSSNGAFLLSPQSILNIYSDPIISSYGTFFYKYDTNSSFIKVHTLDFLASTNYLLKITPLDTNDSLLGMKSKDDLDILKDNLKSVNKMRESRLELTSMINSINNNTFTNNDTILAIKKLANTEKAIIDMLLNIL
jgi:hypothetical protein